MKSPCTLVCSLDTETGYCFGCGRTGSEIAAWTLYSDAERRHIMNGLHERLARLPDDGYRSDARRERTGE